VAFGFAIFGVLLAGAGYWVGLHRGRGREAGLRAAIDERNEKVALLEHELLRRSSLDVVTGLHTQEHFQQILENEWRRASRERRHVSIIMIEIDHAAAFLERQSKMNGDACVKRIAGALKPLVHRPSDVLANYGGAGKFGVVLGGTDGKGAMILAERLRLAVTGLNMRNPESATSEFVTASIGLASAVPDREAAWQDIALIAAAERALERAKEAGRNVVSADTSGALK
jgi:two-component system, chemotaxis family, response regulator WspR